MKHSKRAILKALRIIKSECEGTPCERCPFGGSVNRFTKNGFTKCLLKMTAPAGWVLNDKCETWKAVIVGDSDD